MANSASSDVITLPKGGGALHGIGEKFSPDLHTGTGNFTVPVALPPGRNGFQPQLNLVYSTGNGNGPFGLGWGLSIPGVSRKTSQGIPRYDDSTDTFLLSGAEDLVRVASPALGVTRYRPRTEGLFARIDHHRGPRNDYWEVRSRDGLISLYGKPGAAGDDPTVIADPADRTRIFAWQLTRTTDPFGNRIEYEYDRDLGEASFHAWDQLYLRRIRYVDYETPEAATEFLVSVTFVYDDTDRPDPFSEYRSGFEIRTRRRCARIEVRTHADAERLVRTYDLVYLDQRPELQHLRPLNGASLLSQLRIIGHDDEQPAEADRTQELPPLEFGYTRFEPEKRDFFPIQGADLPPRSLGHPDYELVDLFGNGLPDVLEMNGSVRFWRNRGAGRYDLPREMALAPAGVRLADPGVQLLDANGDGRMDLLITSGALPGYYPLQFGGLWDRRSFQRYRTAPSFDLEDPEVRLVDLDGDGVTDAIRSGSRLECFFNHPQEGWSRTGWVERRALEEFPNVSFSDPRVRWADMTGDGLQDLVLIYDGNIEYWPNLGHGDWGPRVSMRDAPRFPHGYDPRRILLGDVDGDGAADLVFVDHCQVVLYINRSGNGWSELIEIQGTPPVTDTDALRLVDLLGTGISGVLWSTDVGGLARESLLFLDFTGGVKPYLLNEINNHMGAVTRVEYAPSTRFYLEDEQRPETRWQTPLPFPVQVVTRVEVIDELSRGKLTTEYRYHHGYWDGAEREFRGFGMVEQLDTEAFERYNAPGMHGEATDFSRVDAVHFSPPTLTKTWFHQGPIGEEFGDWTEADYSPEFWQGDPPRLERTAATAALLRGLPRRARRDALRALRGRILRTELYALDGTERQNRPYTVTESRYGLREEAPPTPNKLERLRIFFPHVLAQRTTQWERGDEPMTRYSFTGDYDPYGQPRFQINIAVPRWRRSNLGQENRVPSTALPADTPEHIREHARTLEQYFATQTITEYAQKDTDDVYIVDRVARATTYEIQNSGREALLTLKDDISSHRVPRAIIGQTVSFFDGPAFQGLAFAQIGDYGALVRTETLVFTDAILHEAYRSGDQVLDPPEEPPYLAPDGIVGWTAEYPQEFRDRLPARAGYSYQAGGAGSPYAPGYFATPKRCRYDFQDNPAGPHRGLVVTMRNLLGNDTTIAYDTHDLLPVQLTDPVNLTTTADYDYRVFQPRAVTDPNGNRQAFGSTPLGLPAWIAVKGKAGENAGDTDDVPGTRFEYDFLAFANSPPDTRQPVFVRAVRQEHHIHDADVPMPERDNTITTVEYTDGFGRLLQTRTQAEDVQFGDGVFGDAVLPSDENDVQGTRADVVGRQRAANDPVNVAVSGWQTYDNKGRVVEKYEPFFSAGWDYAQPGEVDQGQRVTMYYDPRGQVVHTVNPDGSEQRVVYGVPIDLSDPERFTPTPWEAYTYDENDNAGRTHPAGAQGYRDHWNTPTSIVLDALGRTVESVERNGPDPANDWYVTRSTYDIRGNLTWVIDPLERRAFHYVYDLANRTLRIESIDVGIRRMVLEAAGSEIERRDSKDALILQAYDRLQRPLRLWARDAAGKSIRLRERIEYGDGSDPNQPAAERDANRTANRLGKPSRHYDEAGLLTLEACDFKGNLREKTRRVISDAQILSVFAGGVANNWGMQAYRINWEPTSGINLADHANNVLDAPSYRTSVTYDALNRVRVMRYPHDVAGGRQELRPRYNRAGALERVELDGATYVQHIAYNAKGQRTLIVYGNRVMTRYVYDPQTFRLARMRTERYTQPAPLTYRPTGTSLQDFAYRYDVTGNISTILDRTPGGGIPNTLLGTDALDRTFTYDRLYRLLSATGRECDIPPDRPPWDDRPRCVDVNLTRSYTERYRYDPAGNLARLQHTAGAGSVTRTLDIAPGSNRLASATVGNGFNRRYAYAYDLNGNLLRENTERHFEWDHSDRMMVFRIQVDATEPSMHAHYLYDAGGQRVKKLVRRQGGAYEVTVYIDGLFEHHRRVRASNLQENNTLHVMDDTQRIATIRAGDPSPDDTTPAIKYHLGDHLNSSNVIVNETGAWINREEYSPYGGTSFGSFARKRYRFSGKERDEESGLYYHGARYYAPWLARWMSCDPLGMADGLNLYAAFGDNPVNSRDPTGTQAEMGPEIKYKDNLKPAEGRNKLPKEPFTLEEAQEEAAPAIEAATAPTGRTVYQPNIRKRVSGKGIIVLSPSPENPPPQPPPPPPPPPPELHPPTLIIGTGLRPKPTGAGEEGSPNPDVPLLGHTEHPKPKAEESTAKPIEQKQAASPALNEPAPKVERTLLQVFYRIGSSREELEKAPEEGGPPYHIAVTVTGLVEANVTTSTSSGSMFGWIVPSFFDQLFGGEPEILEVKTVSTPYNKPVPVVRDPASIKEARQRINNPITTRLKD